MLNTQRIKDLAKEKNLSIDQLSELIGCSNPGLYKMINNNDLMVGRLQAIADALGVNIGEFFTDYVPSKQTASGANSVAMVGNGNNVNTITETFTALLQEKDKQIYITQGQKIEGHIAAPLNPITTTAKRNGRCYQQTPQR